MRRRWRRFIDKTEIKTKVSREISLRHTFIDKTEIKTQRQDQPLSGGAGRRIALRHLIYETWPLPSGHLVSREIALLHTPGRYPLVISEA